MTAKSYKVFFSPLAEKELREAWRHIAQHNIAAADRFFDAISARADALQEFPERGVPRNDLRRGLRMLIEGKYLIFYRVDGKSVHIARILFGAQDLSRLFS